MLRRKEYIEFIAIIVFYSQDLLDGIVDNTNLPPAMIPQPKSMESQSKLVLDALGSPFCDCFSLCLSMVIA